MLGIVMGSWLPTADLKRNEPVDIVVAVFAILLAVVIGFTVHRASLCNVRAVAELLTARRIDPGEVVIL